jgi:hypothetical protein
MGADPDVVNLTEGAFCQVPHRRARSPTDRARPPRAAVLRRAAGQPTLDELLADQDRPTKRVVARAQRQVGDGPGAGRLATPR